MPSQAPDAVSGSIDLKSIAVAGNPNSGKTAVFNRLTGLRQRVGNYPGVTVEKREGTLTGTKIVLLDLPGTYSLSARSPDEEIARDVLLGQVPNTQRPDAVLLVIDAANLERNLYLASQILEFGTPMVIACNMMDVALKRAIRIDIEALEKELGVPVIATVAIDGRGIDEIRHALARLPPRNPSARPWMLPSPMETALDQIAQVMKDSQSVPVRAIGGAALLWLMDTLSGEVRSRESAERFLQKLSSTDAEKLRSAAQAVAEQVSDPAAMVIERRYAWISQVVQRVHRDRHSDDSAVSDKSSPHMTDRIDQVLTHRVFGLAIFAGIMFLLFLSIFSWAEPVMNMIEAGQLALQGLVGNLLAEGPLRSLITDGIIAGVGAIVIFFPQICILFLFLAILEDSGYMARAAFLMDRLMSKVGLHGRSFIPLLSSYACAIPGILATRTIENRRDRFTTILVAPFMSCSARLPVYLIVIGAVFADHTWLKAIVMFAMYFLGTVAALLSAMIFKKTIFAGPRPAFILELPPYHMPQPVAIVRMMWDRSKLFLTKAGTTIFAVCVIIWALSYFPRLQNDSLTLEANSAVTSLDRADDQAQQHLLESQRLRNSYLGRLGQLIEPAIRPLGYDWRIGIGILSSFLAREVFVGTMGITFAVGETDETSLVLHERLAGATWPDGQRLFTPLVGVGLMVFYVLACQCVSTLAVVRNETGSWRWPALMFAYMTLLAYGGGLAVYQIGHRLGLG